MFGGALPLGPALQPKVYEFEINVSISCECRNRYEWEYNAGCSLIITWRQELYGEQTCHNSCGIDSFDMLFSALDSGELRRHQRYGERCRSGARRKQRTLAHTHSDVGVVGIWVKGMEGT